jgi:hypothetical protein
MTRRARDNFAIGDRVTLSAEGRALFGTRGRGRAWQTTGVVVGFGRAPFTAVRVRRDGTTTPASYHMAFWERLKCDGNHGGPRCADPECWNDETPEPGA